MKKIGNLLPLILSFAVQAVYCQEPVSVQLTVKSTQGLPLHEAVLNKLFLATVTVNTTTSVGKIFMESPSAFEVRNQGTTTSMNSINGKVTNQTTFQYVVRPKELGTFTLGPASVTVNGDVYSSNAVSILVEEQPVERVTLSEPWLEIRVQDENVVMGQTVPLELRFYHLGLSQLTSLEPPKIQGFTLNALEGPFRGSEEIEGAQYDYIEWRGDMVAKELGTFIVGPAHAVYSMKGRERTHIFQLLSDHFSMGMQQYETDSNVVKLTVSALPAHKGQVHAVGNFTHLSASVNQTTAKQGEGIIFVLELDGTEALKDLPHPALTLPTSVTSYESKSSTPAQKNRLVTEQRKLFEYIMQAREPGTITIPAQTFNFYDPKEKQFKKLVSEPITLTITPDAAALKALDQGAPAQATPATEMNAPLGAVFPLYTQGVAEFRPDTGFSDWLFWALVVLILFGIALEWGKYVWQNYRIRNHAYLRSRAAFHKAHKRVLVARKERNARELYSILIDLFADRRGISSAEVLATDITRWLKEAHIPEDILRQWHIYTTQLQGFAFYDASEIPPVDIFTQAEKWLALLEKTV